MYHILIIDDELERREGAYREFLEPNFELSFVGKPDFKLINEKLNDPNIEALILDMVLDWDKKGDDDPFLVREAFEFMLKLIGRKKPVIVISRQLTYVASWLRGNKNAENDILDFLGWDEIWAKENTIKDIAIKNNFCLRIEWELDEYFRKTQSLKSHNEKITILHITDLQFGDPDLTKNILFSDTLLARTLLNEFELKPDFIAITGDITYNGIPSQFDVAKKWLNNLTLELFPNDFKLPGERILLVPGNHDINLALSSVDAYEYNFKNIQKETGVAVGKNYLVPKTPLSDEHKLFGLMPFCEFAYSVTQDNIWFERANNLNWINDRFSKWGLRFIHLNSVWDLDYKQTKRISLAENSLVNLGRNSDNHNNTDLFTIYLCHNGPYDMGLEVTKESSTDFVNLCGLFNTIKCDLFLHGHLHETIDSKYNIPTNDPIVKNVPFIQTGTVSLNKESRRQDTRRSFSIIELHRNNHKITKVELSTFEYEGYHIEFKKKSVVI